MIPVWVDVLSVCVVLCKLTQILPDADLGTNSSIQSVNAVPGWHNLSYSAEEVGIEVPWWLNGTCQLCYSAWQTVFVQNASKYTSFLFFTRENGFSYTELDMSDFSQSLTNAGFDSSKDTKVVVHGWFGNGSSYASEVLVEGYLNSTEDVNIISVNWPRLSCTLYTMAATAVAPVGRYTGRLINKLVQEMGVSLDSIHCIGHSLGAHICGIAGESVTSGNISRITGLDAALPLFLGLPMDGRLDSSDAVFVDSIHTAGGYLGFYDPIGDVDFYPNGGIPIQPGCGFDIGYCSHERSYYYFAESVTSEGFIATECDSWSDYVLGSCDNNTVAVMGEHVNKSVTGKFYLHTNKKYPFVVNNASLTEEDKIEELILLDS